MVYVSDVTKLLAAWVAWECLHQLWGRGVQGEDFAVDGCNSNIRFPCARRKSVKVLTATMLCARMSSCTATCRPKKEDPAKEVNNSERQPVMSGMPWTKMNLGAASVGGRTWSAGLCAYVVWNGMTGLRFIVELDFCMRMEMPTPSGCKGVER